jgi:hypothetical protein
MPTARCGRPGRAVSRRSGISVPVERGHDLALELDDLLAHQRAGAAGVALEHRLQQARVVEDGGAEAADAVEHEAPDAQESAKS